MGRNRIADVRNGDGVQEDSAHRGEGRFGGRGARVGGNLLSSVEIGSELLDLRRTDIVGAAHYGEHGREGQSTKQKALAQHERPLRVMGDRRLTALGLPPTGLLSRER